MGSTTLEREIKLRFDSVEDARDAILAIGATPLLGRRLQEDALLDTDDEQLRRRRCVLRIRVENGKSRITFKGPVQPSALKVRALSFARERGYRYVKTENESNNKGMLFINDDLGFVKKPAWVHYSKTFVSSSG